jgi:hypothetical protein
VTSPAAQKLGVSLRRPYRGQELGGIRGSMARIAPARPDTQPNGQRQHLFVRVRVFFFQKVFEGWQARDFSD